MGDLRSNTYSRDNRMQIQPYSGAGGFGGGGGGRPTTVFNQESRSYSASYATYLDTQPPISVKELKKGKSTSGSSSKGWGLNDPEFQRKRRVASYKAYSVEGNMKGSFRKSFRWFKDRYYQMIHGW